MVNIGVGWGPVHDRDVRRGCCVAVVFVESRGVFCIEDGRDILGDCGWINRCQVAWKGPCIVLEQGVNNLQKVVFRVSHSGLIVVRRILESLYEGVKLEECCFGFILEIIANEGEGLIDIVEYICEQYLWIKWWHSCLGGSVGSHRDGSDSSGGRIWNNRGGQQGWTIMYQVCYLEVQRRVVYHLVGAIPSEVGKWIGVSAEVNTDLFLEAMEA